jgi:ammonia channel protein AmtB
LAGTFVIVSRKLIKTLKGDPAKGEAPLASNIPHLLYVMFQLVFAAVALAILTLAVAERGSSSSPS